MAKRFAAAKYRAAPGGLFYAQTLAAEASMHCCLLAERAGFLLGLASWGTFRPGCVPAVSARSPAPRLYLEHEPHW